MAGKVTEAAVVGGVDTHKDLHVAAVCFAIYRMPG